MVCAFYEEGKYKLRLVLRSEAYADVRFRAFLLAPSLTTETALCSSWHSSNLPRLRTEAVRAVRGRGTVWVPAGHVNAWCGAREKETSNVHPPASPFGGALLEGEGWEVRFLAAADPSRVSDSWMQFPALCIWAEKWELFIRERDAGDWTQGSL